MGEPSRHRDNTLSGAELVGAGALALGLVAAVYFISSPEREAGRGSSEAVAPKAQITPDLNSPAGTLRQPGRPRFNWFEP
jgi:hypothetical protein